MMNLVNAVLTEITQSQKDECRVILPHELCREVGFVETDGGVVFVRGKGERNEELSLMIREVQFCKIKSVLGMNGDNGCTAM